MSFHECPFINFFHHFLSTDFFIISVTSPLSYFFSPVFQRFCQSYMTELSKYIGPDVDLPGLGDGVNAPEIGFVLTLLIYLLCLLFMRLHTKISTFVGSYHTLLTLAIFPNVIFQYTQDFCR